MSASPDCLDKIIGLSQTTCECFDDGKPFDFDESKSGIYLDQLEGLNLNLAESAEDCDQGGVWDIMDKARNEAIKTFKTDLLSTMMRTHKYRRMPWSGTIGQTKFKNTLNLVNTYAGLRVFSAQIIGGSMTISRIGLAFNVTDTFDIFVYSNVNDDIIAQYSVTSEANKFVLFTLPSPLTLEMNSTECDNVEYYFVYSVAGKQPKDNKVTCGCGGWSHCFNTMTPCFMQPGSYNKDRWAEFVMVAGTQGNDIADRENWGTASVSNGLVLDADFCCRVSDLICDGCLDFEDNDLANVMAYAIRYKAGSFVIDKILSSGNINRFTMTDRETMLGKKNSYNKQYMDRIEYLAEKINYRANDCLVCDSIDDVIKAGIFS